MRSHINTLGPEKMAAIFADDISNVIASIEMFEFQWKDITEVCPQSLINKSALV